MAHTGLRSRCGVGTVGALGAVFCLLLTGCAAWSGSHADDPVGTWGIPDPGQPEVTLEEDGRAHGTDGCNRFTGSWRVDETADTGGTTVTFVDLASTLMACDDIDTWFAETTTATAHGGTLHCFDSDGNEIGALPRQ